MTGSASLDPPCQRLVRAGLVFAAPQGQYDKEADFGALDARMKVQESKRKVADRIFYLSIPPSIFTTVAACASRAASSP